MNKRKLSKLLGKELQYTAILGRFCEQKRRILLTSVEQDNKLYAQHIWIEKNKDLDRIDIGEQIAFKAISYMYNDKFNIRKQGLNKCRSFHKVDEDYLSLMSKEKIDSEHKRRRKG